MESFNKEETIRLLKIEIENLQFDLESDWIQGDTKKINQTKHDLDSLKTILGHLLTLQVI